MKINLTPIELIDQLRAWFHPKDRTVVIPTTVTAVNVSGGATLAMALIQEQILMASATSITFASIPQNFRSLFLVLQMRTDAVAEVDFLAVKFNGDAGANYDIQVILANDTSLTANGLRAQNNMIVGLCEAANSRASNFSPVQVFILGYALTDREKWVSQSVSGAFGNVSADTDMFFDIRNGRWRSTAAIAAITIIPITGPNFVSGSRATLYGLL